MNPTAFMKVEYPAWWGWKKLLNELKNDVEGKIANKFEYHFVKDSEKFTKNEDKLFIVTLFKNRNDVEAKTNGT